MMEDNTEKRSLTDQAIQVAQTLGKSELVMGACPWVLRREDNFPSSKEDYVVRVSSNKDNTLGLVVGPWFAMHLTDDMSADRVLGRMKILTMQNTKSNSGYFFMNGPGFLCDMPSKNPSLLDYNAAIAAVVERAEGLSCFGCDLLRGVNDCSGYKDQGQYCKIYSFRWNSFKQEQRKPYIKSLESGMVLKEKD